MPGPRIHVDFNGLQDDGRIFALRRHADNPEAVGPGVSVELWDEDGNTAQGHVVELADRDLVRIEVALDTWRPGLETPAHPRPPAQPHGVVQDLALEAVWIDATTLYFVFYHPAVGQRFMVSTVGGTASATAEPLTANC